MNYQDMLRILATKKLAQQNSDQEFKDTNIEEPQEEDDGLQEYEIPFPEGDTDEESMLAKLRELVNKKKNLKQT